jgi:hypothetical protein
MGARVGEPGKSVGDGCSVGAVEVVGWRVGVGTVGFKVGCGEACLKDEVGDGSLSGVLKSGWVGKAAVGRTAVSEGVNVGMTGEGVAVTGAPGHTPGPRYPLL